MPTTEPTRFGNADEAALESTNEREWIHLTLTIARAYLDLWGRWPTVQEVEEHGTGKRSL